MREIEHSLKALELVDHIQSAEALGRDLHLEMVNFAR